MWIHVHICMLSAGYSDLQVEGQAISSVVMKKTLLPRDGQTKCRHLFLQLQKRPRGVPGAPIPQVSFQQTPSARVKLIAVLLLSLPLCKRGHFAFVIMSPKATSKPSTSVYKTSQTDLMIHLEKVKGHRDKTLAALSQTKYWSEV